MRKLSEKNYGSGIKGTVRGFPRTDTENADNTEITRHMT